jgi:hypothetical protein
MRNDGEPWQPHEDALLGTESDRKIAQKLGRTSVSVNNRRIKLGIQSSRQKPPSDEDGEE